MFTGLVEELGTVRAVIPNATGARLEIEATAVLDDVVLGASIAVNGCCLTAVEFAAGWWAADAVEETLHRTSLGVLVPGDRVNLERPVRLADRLGGHIVQGHVDGVGEIAGKTPLADGSTRVSVAAPDALLRYVAEKGSIAVDGVSLTVAAVDDKTFEFAMIPHTATVTTLGIKGPGDPVNLEVDLVAKYVERLMSQREG
ncbi:MAG: riboflavin synthase [Actinomycetota bacterium]|jgi:riboflavin synthase